MKCKFNECVGDLTSRDCYICSAVSHHLCSNEYLNLFGFEVENHISFCSKSCASFYIDNLNE